MRVFSLNLLLLLSLIGLHVRAQQPIDNLKAKLKQQTNTAAKLHIMLELGDAYQTQNLDSALHWYTAIIPENISDSAKFIQWQMESDDATLYYVNVALARAGIVFLQKNQGDKGAPLLELAYRLAIDSGNQELAVSCSDNLAVFFARRRLFESAIEYFEKSLEISKELNDINGIAYCLGNLGSVNANLGNLYNAAYYFEQLLALQHQSQSHQEKLDDLLNIAALYSQLKELEKAKGFWHESLVVAQKINANDKLGLILTNLGEISYRLNQQDEAFDYYNQLLDFSTQTMPDKRSEFLAVNNLAIITSSIEKIDDSIEYWEKTFDLAKSFGNVQVALDALINLSNLNYQLQDFEKSSSYFESYLALGKQIADPATIASSYLSIAEIQQTMGNYQKAREYLEQASNLFNETADYQGMANVNVLIGNTFKNEQRYFAAMDFYRANFELSDSLNDFGKATTHQAIANLYRLQMQYTNALEHYQKALDFWIELNNSNQSSVCLNAMGAIHEVTGNLPSAVSSYETALRIAQEIGNREAIAAISNNLGIVYRHLGDMPKALDSYQRALSIYIDIDNHDAASYCYNNLGIIYEQSGNFEKANEYYEKSLAIKQDSQDQQGLATSLMNMGNVYKFLGNYEKAEENYQRALEISNSISDEQGKAFALGSIAALKLEMNDYNTAIDFSKRSLEIAEAIDMKSMTKEAHRQLAWAYNATFIPELAEDAYLKVINMNHDDINRNFSILSESEKDLFFKTVADDFDRFHLFSLHRKESNLNITADVYNNLLRNKGLLLKSSTAMRNAILGSENKELIENFERWIQIRQEIARLYTLPVEQRTADTEDLERQANNLERQLVRNSREFSDFEQSLRIDWSNVRNALEEGEAAIEFTHFTNVRDSVIYCALIVTNDCEIPLMVPLFEEAKLEKILGTFGGNNLTYINGIYGVNDHSNTKLYKLIWEPIDKHLKDIMTVYVSPSGLLHKISFAAISKDKNRYLIDNYNLRMVSTTANVSSDQILEVSPETSVSLFGGISYTTHPDAKETWSYLEGTLQEVEMINSLLFQNFDQVNIVADSLATEEKFKTLAPLSNILHVATHGFFFPDPSEIRLLLESSTEVGEIEFRGGSPTFGMDNFVQNSNPLMRSGLVFAGVNDFWTGACAVEQDDAVLTALEVINIDLRQNQLVVLSACETGLGDIAGSEGVYGLQRAFKMAGTNYLIMSLWQVPDKETAEFMQLFYSLLTQERDLQRAFSQAQTIMRNKYDPFFWAAFVLLE